MSKRPAALSHNRIWCGLHTGKYLHHPDDVKRTNDPPFHHLHTVGLRSSLQYLTTCAELLVKLVPHLIELMDSVRKGADVSYDEAGFACEQFSRGQVAAESEIVRGFVLMLLPTQDSVLFRFNQSNAGQSGLLFVADDDGPGSPWCK